MEIRIRIIFYRPKSMQKLFVFLRIPKKMNKTYVDQTETISHSAQMI